ncbi:hypothetical protein MRX96_022276 [Rhipicephalus microplus]
MAMMIKHGGVMMLLSVFIQMSLSAHNDSKAREEEPDFEQLARQSSTNTTEEPSIAHGCPTIPKHQAGIEDCLYYCRYLSHNNTWLYGYYENGIYCWADDDGENKTRLIGYCLDGICYPTDHDAVTDLSPPDNSIFG